MAKDKQPFEDLSETSAQAVEQNMEKARGAMDNYFQFLQSIWGRNDHPEKHLRLRRIRRRAGPGQEFSRYLSNSD